MSRRGQAREQQRLRVRHGVPDVKMIVCETQTLTADLMTQILSHARKIHVCGSVKCAWVWCSVHKKTEKTNKKTKDAKIHEQHKNTPKNNCKK